MSHSGDRLPPLDVDLLQGKASVVAVALIVATVGCTGAISPFDPAGDGEGTGAGGTGRGGATGTPSGGGGPSGGGSGGPSGGGAGGTVGAECTPGSVASPMRRLTRGEYNNTVRDLLGTTSHPGDAFSPDVLSAGFATNSTVPLSQDDAEALMEAATNLAVQSNLTALLPCAPAAIDAACARKFVTEFGRRAFRRPLQPAEIDALYGVYENKRMRSDAAAGIRLVIRTLLQAPSFLYRPDVAGTDASATSVKARAYELASRLSYFIWGTMPDAALFAAAESGDLLASAPLAKQVQRMVADRRFNDALLAFYEEWSGATRLESVDKDLAAFPQFQPALKASMREETKRFVEHVYGSEKGSLTTLLTARHSFVDAALAKLYGVAAPASGFAKVDLPADQRSGILTHGGPMSVFAFASVPSPIHRGLFVRRRLLCQDVPPPPAGVDITPPPVDPNVSSKQRYAQHRVDPICSGCHKLMEPIGFAFEHYNAVGAWQTMEGKFPVDAKGELTGSSDADGSFDGAVQLGTRLAGSATVRECMSRQWFRFALGREETPDEECVIQGLTRQLVGGGLDLRQLVVSIASSPVFTDSRTPTKQEQK